MAATAARLKAAAAARRLTAPSMPLTAAAFLAAAAWLAGQASGAPAEAPARIRELGVRVVGTTGATSLHVTAALRFEARAGAEVVSFRLSAEHPLRGVADAQGRPLEYARRRDLVLVRAPAGEAAERVWLFEYALSLFRRVEELDTVFSHTGWLPGDAEPAADAASPHAARIEIELPGPLVAHVPGEAQVERTPAGSRFRFSGRATSHPLLVGRHAWRERRADGLTGRVFVPEALDGRSESLLESLLGAAAFYTRRFGSPGRSDFALAALPLGPGQHGITFPGLVVLSADDVADPQLFSERILAHEVAHHWWSLAVRFPDPADAWLAEGLPTYAALLFLEESRGAERLRAELRNSRETALRDRAAPALRVGAAMRGAARYTQNYHKAACVLHALRETLGREAFLALARELYAAHVGGALTTGELARAASTAAGRDLSGFFRGWVERPGLPRYDVFWRVESASGTERAVAGTIRRSGADVEATVRMRVVHTDGAHTDVLVHVTSDTTPFRVACPQPPLELLFDPGGDLLHTGARVRREGR